ncbi:MAG: hypothetical protein NT076_05305 [Candidatus Pacearchaeota archaeon]|nr:hypothetical protein [Candidatus Pacearchaeota archaeon]
MRNNLCHVKFGRVFLYGDVSYVIRIKKEPIVLGVYVSGLNKRDGLGIQCYGFEPFRNRSLEAEILAEFLKTQNTKPKQHSRRTSFWRY